MGKTQNRLNKNKYDRYSVDLIEIRKNITGSKIYRRSDKKKKPKGIIFAFIFTAGIFLLGYFMAGLYIPMWAKALLFAFMAIFCLIPSYFVSAMFHQK